MPRHGLRHCCLHSAIVTVVSTTYGQIRGIAGPVHAFLGVPYAAPPRGPLRFAAPVPPSPWDGERQATAFGPAAPQGPPAPGVPSLWREADGADCLTVNVWTPSPGATGLPVLVWFHGGRWVIGTAGAPQFDGSALAAAGVVVVTVNYRLGFEGFGHVPGAPDNRGLRDQAAALEWVRDNVAAFGGDPGNVTVFGQSAGAASCVLQMGTGLFRRAIAQSIPAGYLARADAVAAADALTEAAGKPVAELPPAAILALPTPPGAFGPVLDGEVVTGPPESCVRADVDLVCGFTAREFRGLNIPPADVRGAAAAFGVDPGPYLSAADPFADLISDALVRVPTVRVALAHAATGGRTWLYEFAWGESGHGVDVPFTFGVASGRYAERMLGTPVPDSFAPLSAALRASWTTFAATGDPGWPRFTERARTTRRWSAEPADVAFPVTTYDLWAEVE